MGSWADGGEASSLSGGSVDIVEGYEGGSNKSCHISKNYGPCVCQDNDGLADVATISCKPKYERWGNPTVVGPTVLTGWIARKMASVLLLLLLHDVLHQ